MWSKEIGQRLDDLSRTMTREAEVEKVCISELLKLSKKIYIALKIAV